jgi:hypothetical protein
VKANVKLNNVFSEDFICSGGVKQGDNLSSFLFCMHINDLEKYLAANADGIPLFMIKLFVILYADDTTIMSQTQQGLQAGLDKLYDYCNEFKLKVNVKKSYVVIFRKGGQVPRNCKFLYGGQQIEIVPHFKFLGLVMSSSGKWSKAITTLADQGNKALFALKSHLKAFKNIEYNLLFKFFDGLVLPILSYGCELWACEKNISHLETIHTRFLKSILHVKASAKNELVYMELGRFPLDVIFKCRMLKYWCKLLQLDANHPCKAAYIDMLSRCHMEDTWASNVKDVLNKIGLGYVWNYQSVEDVNSFFFGIVKQRLQHHDVQHCRSIIEVTSKGRLYNQLNVDFEVQHYCKIIT